MVGRLRLRGADRDRCAGAKLQAAKNEAKRAKAAGFTLIELLVVVGIVALLLSITIGIATKVGELREMTSCASNLRSVGVAAWSLAMDESGRLPEHHLDEGASFDTVSMRRDHDAYVNLGQLLGYVSQAEVLYCPSQSDEASPALAFDSKANPFQRGNPGGDDGPGYAVGAFDPPIGTNSSYAARSLIDPGPRPTAWAIRNFSNRVIYSDFLGVDGWTGFGRIKGQVNAPHDDAGYNRLFGDGAVHWADAEPLEQLRPIDGDEPGGEALRAYYELLDVLP